jgi:hypothetical protein
MLVCPRCKAENDDGRIRCGKCGSNISKRGDYARQSGPSVVILGSVEDLRRAQQMGEIDTSGDDPDALGWLGSDEIEDAFPKTLSQDAPKTRRVDVREIDKISGLKDLQDIQRAILKSEESEKADKADKKGQVTARARVPGKIERGPERPAAPTATTPAAAPAPTAAPARSSAPPAAQPAPPSSVDEEAAIEASAPVAAWLVGELFSEPFRLTRAKHYLLGRDPRASIYLPSAEISRRHAGIAADENGNFWVEDLRSCNGSYVNGHAVLKRKLRENDRLDMGPFSFRFTKAVEGAAAPVSPCDPNEETKVLRAIPGTLVADIERNSVHPVLALLHAGKRSGVLTLRAGYQVGRIFLIAGEIQHAQFGKAVGEQALAALLPAEAGTLHFSDEEIKVKKTIERTTAQILKG